MLRPSSVVEVIKLTVGNKYEEGESRVTQNKHLTLILRNKLNSKRRFKNSRAKVGRKIASRNGREVKEKANRS